MADVDVENVEREGTEVTVPETSVNDGSDAKKRHADFGCEEESASKRLREKDEGRKVTISGLKGMGQEFLQNHMERAGVPYLKSSKQRKQESGFVWFEDNPVIIRVQFGLT